MEFKEMKFEGFTTEKCPLCGNPSFYPYDSLCSDHWQEFSDWVNKRDRDEWMRLKGEKENECS